MTRSTTAFTLLSLVLLSLVASRQITAVPLMTSSKFGQSAQAEGVAVGSKALSIRSAVVTQQHSWEQDLLYRVEFSVSGLSCNDVDGALGQIPWPGLPDSTERNFQCWPSPGATGWNIFDVSIYGDENSKHFLACAMSYAVDSSVSYCTPDACCTFDEACYDVQMCPQNFQNQIRKRQSSGAAVSTSYITSIGQWKEDTLLRTRFIVVNVTCDQVANGIAQVPDLDLPETEMQNLQCWSDSSGQVFFDVSTFKGHAGQYFLACGLSWAIGETYEACVYDICCTFYLQWPTQID